MKKVLALLLAAMMLVGAGALAEQVTVKDATAAFDVSMKLPDGYTMMENRVNGNLYITVRPEEKTEAHYYLSIGFSEEFDGRTLGDLADDEIALIRDGVAEAFAAPEMKEYDTTGGTHVLLFDETAGESDFGIAVTVYKGYFITVQAERPEYAELTEEDLQRAVDLLSGMTFIEE